MKQRVALLADNNSGKIESYFDLVTLENLSREEFHARVRSGYYPEYRIESRNGLEVPVMVAREL